MSTISKAEILKLSIAEAPEEIALTEAQEQELEVRLDAYHKNPAEGSPWAMFRDRVRAGRAS